MSWVSVIQNSPGRASLSPLWPQEKPVHWMPGAKPSALALLPFMSCSTGCFGYFAARVRVTSQGHVHGPLNIHFILSGSQRLLQPFHRWMANTNYMNRKDTPQKLWHYKSRSSLLQHLNHAKDGINSSSGSRKKSWAGWIHHQTWIKPLNKYGFKKLRGNKDDDMN